ncbi:hypothetical protein CAEBREN_07532 [Caenorhabditis brenneri]|uniref:Uncharacterized protein n=1 Tax=Caenorhabditis brenneri TaxID=135651 RepID=G0NBW9_CAEBE|nr:hypothetical protein CAEBREN_07532 [Caenorhabditis brenneri]
MSSSFEAQHSLISEEIQRLQRCEQYCLHGLAHQDQQFQTFAATSQNSSGYQEQFKKTEYAAMATTCTYLFVNNLKEQKMYELAEVEKRIQEQKMSETSLKVSGESGGYGFQ